MRQRLNKRKGAPGGQPLCTMPDLRSIIMEVFGRSGQDELRWLLIEMLEAGQLDMLEHVSGSTPIRYWRAKQSTYFADRFLAMTNDDESAIAELFLKGYTMFYIEASTPFELWWSLTDTSEMLVN